MASPRAASLDQEYMSDRSHGRTGMTLKHRTATVDDIPDPSSPRFVRRKIFFPSHLLRGSTLMSSPRSRPFA